MHLVRPKYVSKRDAATYTSFSISTIDRLIESGVLPVFRTGPRGHTRVRLEDLDRVLAQESA